MTSSTKRDVMEVRHPVAAGLDVHKMLCWIQHNILYVGQQIMLCRPGM